MKYTLMTSALSAALLLGFNAQMPAAFVTFPQSVISFSNVDADSPVYYLQVGNRAGGSGFYVQILGGPVGGLLQPIVNVGQDVSIFALGLIDPGFFDPSPGFGYIPGVRPSGLADFQVRAWHGAPTFDEATERVESGRIPQVPVGFDNGPPDFPYVVPFPFPKGLVIVPIPEPSIMLLMGLGMLGLALRNARNYFRR